MEFGFEYTYKDNSEIFAAIESISSFSEVQFGVLAALIIFISLGVYYLFPLMYLLQKYHGRQKQKAKRKLMLKQISMQKDIEDEIEAEIEEIAKAQAEANK